MGGPLPISPPFGYNNPMSGNRFEFLEFGDGPPAAPPEPAAEDPATETPAFAPRGSDSLPLAQVRITDPRGYGAFLEQEKQAATARLDPLHAREARLRLAEVIGGRGVQAGQFNVPAGLAVDGGGVLFVADSYNHRVQRITPSGGVAVIGGRGNGRGQFLSPQGVATDASQAFYIVEQGNHRVQKFSGQGVLELIFGRAGRGAGELHGPTGIAVAPGTGDIYVADTGNRRVQKFDADGNYLATLGGQGGLYAPLLSPQALAVDAGDHLYVADTLAHRIVRYDPLGRPVGGFRPTSLHEPRALACDALGLLYVADTVPTDTPGAQTQGRLQALEHTNGNSRATLTTLPGRGAMTRPGGLAVSGRAAPGSAQAHRDIYVADSMNHRILRFTWN